MPRTLSEAHKAALAEGRAKKAAEKAAVVAKSFEEFSRWSERDAVLWASFDRGEITRDEYKNRSGRMPAIVTEEAA